MHTYIHTYIHTYARTHTHTHTHIYVYIHVCIRTDIYPSTYISFRILSGVHCHLNINIFGALRQRKMSECFVIAVAGKTWAAYLLNPMTKRVICLVFAHAQSPIDFSISLCLSLCLSLSLFPLFLRLTLYFWYFVFLK